MIFFLFRLKLYCADRYKDYIEKGVNGQISVYFCLLLFYIDVTKQY